MKQIKAVPITHENFAPYGQFYPIGNPQGYPLCGAIHKFYPDRITTSSRYNIGFSSIVVTKPEKMIITQQEYHTSTWEMIMPLDDDMVIHVAPASGGTPIGDQSQAFIVPKNTMVKLNAAIWHLAPLPVNNEKLTAMIILPECTYANDCPVVDLPADQQFEIVLP